MPRRRCGVQADWRLWPIRADVSSYNIRRIPQTNEKGGLRMKNDAYWEWFCMTGEPLAYVLYRQSECPDQGVEG